MRFTEDTLEKEIRAAEDNRRQHLYRYEDNIKSYLGPAYWDKYKNSGEILNRVYESVAVALPKHAYTRPKVLVHGRTADAVRLLEHGMSKAEEMTHVMNRWAKDCRIERTLRQVALDYHLAFGCLLTRREEYTGWVPEELVKKAYHPKLYRLSPEHVFWDPVAQDSTQLAYTGHGYWMDGKDLLALAKEGEGWDLEAVREIVEERDGQFRDERFSGASVRRDDVYVRQVWVPGLQPDKEKGPKDGFHGAIYWTASCDTNAKIRKIREPQPYYGPKHGPYTIFGAYPASGGAFPLAPAVATRNIHDKTTELANKYLRQATSFKKGTAIPADHADIAPILQQFQDTGFLALDTEASKNVRDISVGGADRTQLEALNFFMGVGERQTGVDSQQLGSVDPRGTATASMIAANSAQSIGGYLTAVFEEGVLDALQKVGWFFYSDDKALMQIGVDVSEAGDDEDIWYQPDSDDAPYEVLEMEIELNSMSMGGDIQRRAAVVESMQLIQQLAMAQTQFGPIAPWERMAKVVLETNNLGGLARDLDFEGGGGAPQQQPMQEGAGFNPPPNPTGLPLAGPSTGNLASPFGGAA